MNPDRPCPHLNFEATVDVGRMMDGTDPADATAVPTSYSADIRIRCADCDEPFRFIGVQAGLMPTRPMCSPDETELRAPVRPASSDPDFGMGLPGFAVRFVEGEPEPNDELPCGRFAELVRGGGLGRDGPEPAVPAPVPPLGVSRMGQRSGVGEAGVTTYPATTLTDFLVAILAHHPTEDTYGTSCDERGCAICNTWDGTLLGASRLAREWFESEENVTGGLGPDHADPDEVADVLVEWIVEHPDRIGADS